MEKQTPENRHTPQRTEPVWDGKQDKEGERVAPLRVELPFQTGATVSQSSRVRTAVLIITAVYLLVRVFPLMMARPDLSWETAQAKQWQKYGWWERRGAWLPPEYSHGTVAHPERFNYSHHPYLGQWLVAGTVCLLGPVGGMGLLVVLGLAACLATYFALRLFCQPMAALFTTCLVAASPVLVSITRSTNPHGLGGSLWPVGVLLIGKLRSESKPRAYLVFLLGLTVFLAGQITWFTFIILPGLIVTSSVPRITISETFWANLRNPLWKAICLGAFLSACLFALQVAYYEPSLYGAAQYAQSLASTSGHGGYTSSHIRMFFAVLLRSTALNGTALILGCFMGILFAVRQRRLSPVLAGGGVCLACFAILAIVWPFFFVREQWVHAYNSFPLACFTASALERLKRPAAFWFFGLLGLVGVIIAQLTASLPSESLGSRTLAKFLMQHTAPTDLVVSNFRPYEFPFAAWDDAACYRAATRADRLFFWAIDTVAALEDVKHQFDGDLPTILFIKQVGAPIDPDLDEKLKTEGRKILTSRLVFPVEKEGLAVRLRSFYWKLQGRGGQLAQEHRLGQPERVVTVELYLVGKT